MCTHAARTHARTLHAQARAGSELLLLDAESINGSSSLSPQQQAGPLPGGMWGERGPPSPKGPGSGGRQAFQ